MIIGEWILMNVFVLKKTVGVMRRKNETNEFSRPVE
jgi:hypothetical protein